MRSDCLTAEQSRCNLVRFLETLWRRDRPDLELRSSMTGLRASWRNGGERKPRVLVADDNALILSNVSSLLATNFDLVAAVTDGRQALDAARRLDPDVVVLDVTMPGLNGFQTARQLTRSGSRSKIVMLTMHVSDEFLAAAIDAGADGYVPKPRMMSDLEGAIDHAIAGRLFVPSLTSLLAVAPSPGVADTRCSSADSDRRSSDELSGLLAAAFRRGDVAAIVATDATRAGGRATADREWMRYRRVPQTGDVYISLDVSGGGVAGDGGRAARRWPASQLSSTISSAHVSPHQRCT